MGRLYVNRHFSRTSNCFCFVAVPAKKIGSYLHEANDMSRRTHTEHAACSTSIIALPFQQHRFHDTTLSGLPLFHPNMVVETAAAATIVSWLGLCGIGVSQLCGSKCCIGKGYILKACERDGTFLRHAPPRHRNDRDVVLTACAQNGMALRFATPELKMDKGVVLTACRSNGEAIQFAKRALLADRDVAIEACIQNGSALRFVARELRSDPRVVQIACLADGNALQYATEEARSDKTLVLVAASSSPESLKYAAGGLNQDLECLIQAGLLEQNYERNKRRKVVLSTRFALGESSSPIATQFAVALKEYQYIKEGDFIVYSPNAYKKKTCDLEWTRSEWPCRGTFETCRVQPSSLKIGVPTSDCCWRYSFRYQLEEAKRTNGFMIQVIEYNNEMGNFEVGRGQQIETDMAQQVGIKIFRFYDYRFNPNDKLQVKDLVEDIKYWYNDNCNDMSEVDVFEDITYQLGKPIRRISSLLKATSSRSLVISEPSDHGICQRILLHSARRTKTI